MPNKTKMLTKDQSSAKFGWLDPKNIFSQMSVAGWMAMAVLLILAAILRLYNVSNTLIFQSDQGRDAIIVANIFKHADVVAIGPTTSVGNLYLGPLYYYFMLPFLWLSYPSPLGPVYAVALVGVLTVFVSYWWGRQILGHRSAAFAALLIATGEIFINFNRFSWNPNIIPFFALAAVFASYKALRGSPYYWVGAALSLSVLLQLHYITIIMAAGIGLCWLFAAGQYVREAYFGKAKKEQLVQFVLATFLSTVVIVASFIPVVAFDIKHNGLNASAFTKLFTKEKILTGDKPVSGVEYAGRLSFSAVERLRIITVDKFFFVNGATSWAIFVVWLVLTAYLLTLKDKQAVGRRVLSVFLISGVIGISLYKYSIFDHYLLFILPISVWTWADILGWLSRQKLRWLGLVAVLGFFLWSNVPRYPFETSGWTIFNVKNVSDQIAQKLSEGTKYDVVLLSESGDILGNNYRYFLSTSQTEPKNALSVDDIDTLVIINENYRKDLRDLQLPIVQNFPQTAHQETFAVEGGPTVTIWRK